MDKQWTNETEQTIYTVFMVIRDTPFNIEKLVRENLDV